MPLESHSPQPKEQAPRPYYPALLPGVAVGLFLVSISLIGTGYELRPPSEFRPENVEYQVIDESSAERLRSTAEQLRSVAVNWEAQVVDSALSDSSAKRLTALASLYRARADRLTATVASRDAVLAKRHAKRVLWVYAAAFDVVICVFGSLVVLAVAYAMARTQHVPRRKAARVLATMFIPSLVGALLFVAFWYDRATPPYALIEATLTADVLWAVRVNDGLHILTVSLIMWFGVFAAPPSATWAMSGAPATEADLARGARELADANRLFRIALYFAAAMLVAYVAAVSSLFQWVLAFVDPDKTVYAAVEELANSAITGRALLASGLLVFGFGASAALVRLIGFKLARRALPQGSTIEREAWTTEQGLVAIDLRQQLRTLAAILAPLATGVIAQIVNGLA